MKFIAIERSSEVAKAVRLFQNKTETDCSSIGGFPRGSTSWNAKLGFWSHFQKWKRRDGTDRYWNGFGFQTDNLRRRVIVEINPPVENMYKGMQGIVAKADGATWFFHRGGLSSPGRRITEEEFYAHTKLTRAKVEFSDGREISCFPIANLEDEAHILQRNLCRYINKCKRVRHFYMFGAQVADFEGRTSDLDEYPAINPEMTTSYLIPKQAAKLIERKHGQVWNALVAELEQLHLPHTNERIGRWGPDLIIPGKGTLFEIKVTTDASDVQKALGQLLLYEALTTKSLKKVLIIPGALHQDLQKIFHSLGICFLYYSEKNRKIIFEKKEIMALL